MSSPALASHPTGRLRGLDGLRGGAAVAVMLYHYLEHGPKLHPELGAFWAPAGYGEEGVRLFFVISGFVITMSLRRSTLRDFVVAVSSDCSRPTGSASPSRWWW